LPCLIAAFFSSVLRCLGVGTTVALSLVLQFSLKVGFENSLVGGPR
jgi:hypothetical protein